MTAPSRVGRYEIVRRLSKSMTDVYLAIDTIDNRQAALKLIKAAPDAMTQMILEAERRGAGIQKELRTLDPRVVEIYDFGDADGYFFVAMQYVEGRNLAQVLQSERRIDPARAARVAMDICAQLAKFHTWQSHADGPASPVVHGDIKPSNIHLGPNDTVRLLDFGIAKALRPDHDATMHNFGSPGYCSPERLARMQVDQQSDLWALGATLYEMLAGTPPYQAENTRKLEMLIKARRPPRALPGDCPRPLCAIVLKALAPDPGHRYPSARVLHDDLEAFLDGRFTLAEAQRSVRWRASPTLEVAREYLRRVTRTISWRNHGTRAAEGAVWFVIGMALWMGAHSAWQVRQISRERERERPAPAPVVNPSAILRAEYLRTANRVIDGYRTGADPDFSNADWRVAETSLDRLIELGVRDPEVIGKLALSKGYTMLGRLAEKRYPPAAAEQFRLAARDQFAQAAQHLPQSPDPHLALARVFVYSLPDLEKALAEFAAAERLGYRMAPREIEQQADAYRLLAEKEFAEARRVPGRARAADLRERAHKDANWARALYRQIRGFDQADRRLHEIARLTLYQGSPPKVRRARRWR